MKPSQLEDLGGSTSYGQADTHFPKVCMVQIAEEAVGMMLVCRYRSHALVGMLFEDTAGHHSCLEEAAEQGGTEEALQAGKMGVRIDKG
jgi:hypothetical protein